MQFRELCTDDERNLFAQEAERHIDVRFPLEYLQRARVVAICDQHGKMYGGYMIVTQGPFRCIESLPQNLRAAHPFFKSFVSEEACEFNGLWLAPQLRRSWTAATMWLRIYSDLLRAKRRHIVYAYDLRKEGLARVYRRVGLPEVLYRGQTQAQPGMKQEEVESVEATSLRKILFAPLRQPHFLIERLRFRAPFMPKASLPNS